MDNTRELLRVLDAVDRSPGVVKLRRRGYALLAGRPGARVLDAGCGSGRAVGELRALGAESEGVDLDADMIEVARSRYPGSVFRVADVHRLPYGDGELQGYRADKLPHTPPDPARAVAEARRVLAPGGRAVLVGQDWDTARAALGAGPADHPDAQS